MLPAGPLMIEHRLIERFIRILDSELIKIKRTDQVDFLFMDMGLDFFRTYADRIHHGKEEDILFKGLAKKQLKADHKKILDELIRDHIFARKRVGDLGEAKEKYMKGDKAALKDIAGSLQDLTTLYPAHIEKEDKHFFLPVMDYFSKDEQEKMLEQFREFDRCIIHEKYTKLVEGFEKKGL